MTGKEAFYPDGGSYLVDSVSYIYDSDGNVSCVSNPTGSAENYSYDYFGRLTENTLKIGNNAVLTDEYTYINIGSDRTTGLIDAVISSIGDNAYRTVYTYDVNGNITNIAIYDLMSTNAVYNVSYAYDSLGQLVRENNGLLNKTYIYTYDSAGNIKTKNTYNYTTGALGNSTVVSYGYSESAGDRLISFGGAGITYDGIGNPLSYYNGYQFTWQNGRELVGATNGSTSVTYQYNYDGIRVVKTVNGILHEYTLDGTTFVDIVSIK